jgi:hypothetical protein
MRALLVACALALAAAPASAQHWRTLGASRQLRDTGAVAVHLEYDAGKLDLKSAAGPLLYQVALKYDAEHAEPVTHFDSTARSLTLGVRSRGVTFGAGDKDAGALHAELSAKVPMDLTLDVGATEAEIQLGGLRISDFTLHGGASDITVDFASRNSERLRLMVIEVGAADAKVRHLANSGVERLQASVGVGHVDLDLSGALQHDVDLTANVGMGAMELHVAPDVGVRVNASTFLASFEKAGLEKRGDSWYTQNYDAAARKVNVTLRAVLGGFTLTRDGK